MSDTDHRFRAARLVLALRQAGVTDQRVTQALETTPRDLFAARGFADDAWENVELPIDCGQTMTRPVTAALMLQALDVGQGHAVLEIGAGSGFVTALLARLARRVYSIERFRTLVERAQGALERSGLAGRIELRLGDGASGWAEAAPFERILIMACASDLPEDLARQLAPGGVAVMPVERDGEQVITRFEKRRDGAWERRAIAPARFGALEAGVAREL